MSDELSLRLTTPGDREIVMMREFRAPRHRVNDAYTKPELLRRWFGPHGYTLVVCDIDLRVDGHWRYVEMRSDMARSGMADGLGGGYERLAGLLVTLND